METPSYLVLMEVFYSVIISYCSDKGKVEDTLTLLREIPETIKAKAQFIIATDGQ